MCISVHEMQSTRALNPSVHSTDEHTSRCRHFISFTSRQMGVTDLFACGLSFHRHNFVHTDLHPGNMLVRMIDARGDIVSAEDSGIGAMLSDAPASTPATAPTTSHGGALRPQLVLIDYGLAEELTPDVRTHFISFLNCIASGTSTQV